LSTKDKLVIAQQVGKSSKLQQIAAVCGRFTRIALQQQKTRVKHPPDEITSITTGNEIERLLPSEIALLADPDLEDLFYLNPSIGLKNKDSRPQMCVVKAVYPATSHVQEDDIEKEHN